MTDASCTDAARASVPEAPVALQPTSEKHRWYCDPADDASNPVTFSRAPRGVAGGEDLFAPARALLESVTLGEYLDARCSEPEHKSGRAGRLVTTLDVSTTADEALRVLAKAQAHSAPLVDEERRAFLGFLDVDDLLAGFFAHVERAVPPPSMPASSAAAAAEEAGIEGGGTARSTCAKNPASKSSTSRNPRNALRSSSTSGAECAWALAKTRRASSAVVETSSVVTSRPARPDLCSGSEHRASRYSPSVTDSRSARAGANRSSPPATPRGARENVTGFDASSAGSQYQRCFSEVG